MVQQFASQQFHRTDMVLSVDSSDLGMQPGEGFGQVYNDAIDEGFYIRSESTGKLAPFVLDSTMEANGDVIGWKFKAARPNPAMFFVDGLARYDDYKNLIAVVYND
jgi:hypothetical protein